MSVLLMGRLLWLGLGAVRVPGSLVEGSLGLNGFKRLQTLLWLLPCNISRGVLRERGINLLYKNNSNSIPTCPLFFPQHPLSIASLFPNLYSVLPIR